MAKVELRLLAYITKETHKWVLRKNSQQAVMIPRPRQLQIADIKQYKQVLKPSEVLPPAGGAGFEIPKDPSLQTKCTVKENEEGIWLLTPEKTDDQIVIESLFTFPEKELRLCVVLGEKSTLRFTADGWVRYQGSEYSGGGITMLASGNQFLEGTRKKSGTVVLVLSKGSWLDRH